MATLPISFILQRLSYFSNGWN